MILSEFRKKKIIFLYKIAYQLLRFVVDYARDVVKHDLLLMNCNAQQQQIYNYNILMVNLFLFNTSQYIFLIEL